MSKPLFLYLAACTLAIAPGCYKRNVSSRYCESVCHEEKTEILQQDQLEKNRKKYKNRGIALTAAGSVTLAAGGASTAFAAVLCQAAGPLPLPTVAIVCAVTGGVALVGGAYMLGQGMHDLAKAKRLHRIQMKEAARKRQADREAQAQTV